MCIGGYFNQPDWALAAALVTACWPAVGCGLRAVGCVAVSPASLQHFSSVAGKVCSGGATLYITVQLFWLGTDDTDRKLPGQRWAGLAEQSFVGIPPTYNPTRLQLQATSASHFAMQCRTVPYSAVQCSTLFSLLSCQHRCVVCGCVRALSFLFFFFFSLFTSLPVLDIPTWRSLIPLG